MKIQKLAVPVILFLTAGCTSVPRLPEPYETRYFTKSNVQSNLSVGYLVSNEDFNKQCKGVRFFSPLVITEKNIIVMEGSNLSEIDTKTPYHIVAKKDDDRYLASDSDRHLVQVPVITLEKCTITEDVYKKQRAEKEQKRAIAKKEAAEKKAKVKAEKKRKAEQEVTEKNNYVIKKYGKPYCIPYTVENSMSPFERGGSFKREKNCLFEAQFVIQQVTSDGMLVTAFLGREDIYYFVINSKNTEAVDGESIGGLFEYVGNYTYESLSGTKTVLKFKHIE